MVARLQTMLSLALAKRKELAPAGVELLALFSRQEHLERLPDEIAGRLAEKHARRAIRIADDAVVI